MEGGILKLGAKEEHPDIPVPAHPIASQGKSEGMEGTWKTLGSGKARWPQSPQNGQRCGEEPRLPLHPEHRTPPSAQHTKPGQFLLSNSQDSPEVPKV